jgi:hypothetical protein
VHEMLRDVSAAMADIEQIKRELTGTTSGPRSGQLSTSYSLARLEAARGQQGRAAEHLDEGLRLGRLYMADFPDLEQGPAHLAVIHALRGEKEAALSNMGEAMARVSRTRDVSTTATPGDSIPSWLRCAPNQNSSS